MGLHWDYRIVLGDKAYSWATKKEMPEPGKSIILFEQPVHDREYALSEKVVIPKGEYGGGTTYLDWVRKAKIDPENEPGKIVVKTKDGERFLIKKLDAGKYGEKSWLFKNLTPYKEGPDSTFTHLGKEYSVDDVISLAAGSKITKTPISEIDWALAGAKIDPSRLEKADVTQPILLTNWGDKKVVIDGTHRLYKAKTQGLESISTKYVDLGKLEKRASVFSITQALDNSGEDLHFDHTHRRNITDANHRSMTYFDMAQTAHYKGHEYRSGNVLVKRSPNKYLVTIDTNAKDVVGRSAPLTVHLDHHNIPDVHRHVQDAISAANKYHSQFKVGTSDFSVPNLEEDLTKAVAGVHKVRRNSILKKTGLGLAAAGVIGLGINSYTKKSPIDSTSKLEKTSKLVFVPDLTPAQMEILGTLKHKGSQYGEGEDKDNFFGVSASQKTWPESWHNEQHPQGWYQWYKGYAEGKRTDDDERQIKRWLSFKARHLAQLQKADPTLSDLSIQPKRRQALLNWAIAPGINVEQEVEKKNKYLVKVAEKTKWNNKADLDAAMSVAGLIGIPLGMAANKLGGDVGKSVHVPAPDIANKYTVRHFLCKNPVLHDKVIFERRNGSIPPSVRGISNHTGPAYVNRSFMPDSPNHDVIVGMQGKGKNHAVTMHELGHAKDFNTGNTKLKLGLTRLRSGLGVTAASTLAYGLATNDKTENYAPLASLIPGAVTLRAETAANVHAYKGIKSHMGSGSANKFLKKFIPKQMGAYAIGAAIPAVTTLTAVHMLKSKRKAREEHRAKIAAKKALELK